MANSKFNRGKKSFWDKEYKNPKFLDLSDKPAEDLEKFVRWLYRRTGKKYLNPTTYCLDIGCGNGRNLIYLSREFGVRGRGFDISTEATKQATIAARGLPLQFDISNSDSPIAESDSSVDIVLDMIVSHVLPLAGREKLRDEIHRVLKPGGYLFFKTFLLDEDLNAKRMIRENPTSEQNSFIHPTLGNFEHVWTEDEIYEFFAGKFEIEKIEKSYKHLIRGRSWKRRHIIAYLSKI